MKKAQSIIVSLPEKQYPIYIERGLIKSIGSEIKKIYAGKRIVIITDNNVQSLYGGIIENSLEKESFVIKTVIIEPGEKSKSFEILQRVCEEILEFGLARGDLIIAFGGGVVGDLGGFAASILLRGIAFVQIPTTLLAQIDSSVGGKVAINSISGKNLIGSFYQPEAVFIDPDLLNTLSERVFNDGMAEVIKCAAIKDERLFYKLLEYDTKETLISNIEELIYTCCNIKKNVVQLDEKDLGERMLLNFGHTIGHAIEKLFNYETFTHGEAVAMGMIAITRNSERLGITESGSLEILIKLVNKYDLPSELPHMDKDEFLKALLLDKKNINEDINLIFLKKIGISFIKKINSKEIDKYVELKREGRNKMSTIEIIPGTLKGEIPVPPSKSLCHRAIIAAGLATDNCNIENVVFSEDILATCNAMRDIGVSVIQGESNVIINGNNFADAINSQIDCKESGSTLRFLIPIVLLTGSEFTFTGKGRLAQRPLTPYYKMFKEQDIKYSSCEGLPLTIQGKLKAGVFKLPGNISSQFITGLLFALPLLDGDSKIIVTSDLESKAYVDLTIDMLSKFSVQIENVGYTEINIKGNQEYVAKNYTVEGDFSQAAFWLVAGILGGEIQSEGMNINSLQGDLAIVDLIAKMGGNISIEDGKIKTKQSKTHGIIIDASECPDLVPILAVLASLSEGTTKIINASRLRIKECDRLKAMATELTKLGGDVVETEDGLIINGVLKLKGGTVDSWNDHRIAMALSVASIRCKQPVILTNSACVNKSYPKFYKDFEMLGGIINEWSLGK